MTLQEIQIQRYQNENGIVLYDYLLFLWYQNAGGELSLTQIKAAKGSNLLKDYILFLIYEVIGGADTLAQIKDSKGLLILEIYLLFLIYNIYDSKTLASFQTDRYENHPQINLRDFILYSIYDFTAGATVEEIQIERFENYHNIIFRDYVCYLVSENQNNIPAEKTSAYLTAVGILNDATVYDFGTPLTGAEIWTITNNMFSSLYSNSINHAVICPFLGLTTAAQKYNAQNPLDLDTSFRIIFNDGTSPCTHDKYGVTVGTDKYANLKYIPQPDGLEFITGASAFWYSRTVTSNPGYVWGGYGFTTYYSDASNTYIAMGADLVGGILSGSTPFAGRHMINMEPSGTTNRYLKNGSLVEAVNRTFVRFSDAEIWLGAIKDTVNPFSTIYASTDLNFGFFAIGYGLTQAQETIADGIFNTFLTAIGR